MPPLTCLILAAGKGTRMRSRLPKVMHALAGVPMIAHVLDKARDLEAERIAVVVGPEMDDLVAAVAPCPTVVQAAQRGTGDAVRVALDAGLVGAAGDVLVLFGDAPLSPRDAMAALVERRRAADDPAVVVLGIELANPARFGRLRLGPSGDLLEIVEAADADADTLAITLCNAGMMAIDAARLGTLLGDIEPGNTQGEYYLTDLVAAARARGWTAAAVTLEGDNALLGINSRAELAAAERLLQDALRAKAMEEGVTLMAPETVFLAADTRFGRDVTVEPNVVFGPGVTVEEGATVRAFSHLEGATVRKGAVIGPFARLRPGAEIGPDARVGNFVEVKNAVLGAGAKANHLSYLGDADIGPGANIGAGTITCNYDGYLKHRTAIGAEAFIGSNTALVAPVTIGERANVGAGSTITGDVPADALAVARGRQEVREGWAAKYRARMAKDKAAKKAR
ncbi:MAG: bifunctional UDP-N-acetylglucosamine diphosphorylase/glucosamine-1-phosphate N-acetyltransferase GlmU [Azospirillaceae bacterium]